MIPIAPEPVECLDYQYKFDGKCFTMCHSQFILNKITFKCECPFGTVLFNGVCQSEVRPCQVYEMRVNGQCVKRQQY